MLNFGNGAAKSDAVGSAALFDGNKESLASDVWYTPGYNKCVCVDIHFVLWTLQRYAGMDRILSEMKLPPGRSAEF